MKLAAQKIAADEPQTLRLWLSDQQWMSLICRIEQGRTPPPSDDVAQRRRWPRVPVTLRCMVRLKQANGWSATFAVRSCNLSRGGLGFLHDRPIAPGAACTVALEWPDTGGRVLPATVAWCRPVPNTEGIHEVGLKFTWPIDLATFVPDSAA